MLRLECTDLEEAVTERITCLPMKRGFVHLAVVLDWAVMPGHMAVACSHSPGSAPIVRLDDWSGTEELCRMVQIQAGMPPLPAVYSAFRKQSLPGSRNWRGAAHRRVPGLSGGDPGYFGVRPGAAGSMSAGGTAVPELAWSYVRSGDPVRQKRPAATRTSRQGRGQVTPPGSRLYGCRARTKSRSAP